MVDIRIANEIDYRRALQLKNIQRFRINLHADRKNCKMWFTDNTPGGITTSINFLVNL